MSGQAQLSTGIWLKAAPKESSFRDSRLLGVPIHTKHGPVPQLPTEPPAELYKH